MYIVYTIKYWGGGGQRNQYYHIFCISIVHYKNTFVGHPYFIICSRVRANLHWKKVGILYYLKKGGILYYLKKVGILYYLKKVGILYYLKKGGILYYLKKVGILYYLKKGWDPVLY